MTEPTIDFSELVDDLADAAADCERNGTRRDDRDLARARQSLKDAIRALQAQLDRANADNDILVATIQRLAPALFVQKTRAEAAERRLRDLGRVAR